MVLTAKRHAEAQQLLAARDDRLAAILDAHGPAPLWPRPPGLPTLVQIILEQQVSLHSARITFERLVDAVGPLSAERLAEVDEAFLVAAGLTRQKRRCVRLLARAVRDGTLPLDRLETLSDDEARGALTAVTGIGPWTADVYLLMALRRPDIWPAGDLALAVALQRLDRRPARPTPAEVETLGEVWRPWRAVAARILWHDYLSTRA